MTNCIVRDAEPADSALIAAYIHKLAAFENLADTVKINEQTVRKDFFEQGLTGAVIVEKDGTSAGFAVYYYIYSTFAGKPSLYVEDIFIDEQFRHQGLAHEVFRSLARKASERGCIRLQWSVLEWNTNAITFYRSIGGTHRKDWQTWYLELHAD